MGENNKKENAAMGAIERINLIADEGTFEPWYEDIPDSNPLGNEGYPEKLAAARAKTGISEGIRIGKARIKGMETVLGVCDAGFIMGSMGYVVGERVTRAFERATKEKLSVIIYCCSGGARMQEGIVSLMQMEKTSAAIKRHSDAGLFYCPVLTDPTMGGVTASFAMLGDIIIGEPGARVGFAGPRVIQQTIGQNLPEGFQTAEFLLDHGMIDLIVDRNKQRDVLSALLLAHSKQYQKKSSRFAKKGKGAAALVASNDTSKLLSNEKTPWEKVKACRQKERPSSLDYINNIFDAFIELHGDRCYDDDRALVGGLAFMNGQPVTVMGEVRGGTMQECIERNFGMPMPDGYRKAVRLMKQAEKFNRPIISFITTPGAFCGIEAEERGQGEAIARSIMEMAGMKVPVLCIMIGEGGSGGALATAVGNQVWMMEHATYAILSPEGYSSIVWKTNERAEEAASAMKMTAQDLYEMKIVDRIVPEFGCTKVEEIKPVADYLKKSIEEFIKAYKGMSGDAIEKERYERFRKF
ncbi:MAG: acetyl-CoA carboxylase carboxyltransferase subunit alpha [Lachnospiraceae bacterium]|nr:acetyl-CoA carboxylase carboxyltransferase subunit alpha [Lachnospiraceae bacterium]